MSLSFMPRRIVRSSHPLSERRHGDCRPEGTAVDDMFPWLHRCELLTPLTILLFSFPFLLCVFVSWW